MPTYSFESRALRYFRDSLYAASFISEMAIDAGHYAAAYAEARH